MPLPWLDTWAPSQFVTQPQLGNPEAVPVNSANTASSTYDTTITHKMAGMVILALVLVFVLEKLGFRFVTAGSVSAGVGR
jgi:hypothetical protein